MKALFFSTSLLLSSFSLASELPVLPEKPWLGYWVGYESREFDFGVGGRGVAEIMMKERGKSGMERISLFRSLKVHYIVEEQIGGKWQRRTLEEDQFETSQEASAEVEEFSFLASYKGETQVKVNHVLDGKKIKISTELVKTASKNPLRVGVELLVPDLYRLKEDASERETKKMMKGDGVRLTLLNGKKLKYNLYDEVSLGDSEVVGEGAAEFSLECKNLADMTVSLSSATPKTGKILFKQKKPLHSGFAAIWYPEATTQSKELPTLLIEVK